MKTIVSSGARFGKLTVVNRLTRSPDGAYRSLCKCDCGELKKIRNSCLSSGFTKSCGCMAKHNHRTHGMSRSPTYTVWACMIQRCHGPKIDSRYSGRGIRVCDRWRKFENFLQDMGIKPEGHSIERENNNGDYCPDNCVWIPRKLENRNRRDTVWVTLDGVRMCAAEAASKLGVDQDSFTSRIRRLGYVPYSDARTISGQQSRGRCRPPLAMKG